MNEIKISLLSMRSIKKVANNDHGVISLKVELKSTPAIIARSDHRKVTSNDKNLY